MTRDAQGRIQRAKGRAVGPDIKQAAWWVDWSEFEDSGARRHRRLPSQALLLELPSRSDGFSLAYTQWMAKIGVFRFSPGEAREGGTPTPNPTLATLGSNLPALVDWLQRKHKPEWRDVLDAMRDVVPAVEDIVVQVLPTKTLGLYFTEEGVGRPWRADEVSDGTMHALCLLVACADPRVSALVIEEPENSLHPWALKELGKRLRDVSRKETVMVTTQSPVFIDLLRPSETWIVSRRRGQTSIRRLTEIDPKIERDWEEGDVGLSEYLDAGLVPRAVPGREQS
jgi:predicted ATPase